MPYLWLDATYLKVQEGGRILSKDVMIAVAVNEDGKREVLGVVTGPSEAKTFWTEFLRSLPMQEDTLQTLSDCGAFSKLRMCVFPKNDRYSTNEPLHHVCHLRDDGKFHPDRPNSAAFRHLDAQVARLADTGIEVDVIMFHPYDRQGYANMTVNQTRASLRDHAPRLSAYCNVWWALASEYEFLLDTFPVNEWDGFCHLPEEHDHVGHLRSIHNGDQKMTFDHRKPWITDVCLQNWEMKRTPERRDGFGNPVVNDEPEYEGPAWNNITAQDLVHRFWTTVPRGGHAGHGETYAAPDDLIWQAKGGKLHGQARQRIAFLRQMLEDSGVRGLEPMGPNNGWPWSRVSGAVDLGGKVSLLCFGEHQPNQWTTGLPTQHARYQVDLIDTWTMTVEPEPIIPAQIPHPTRHGDVVRGGVADAVLGEAPPGRPGHALRITQTM